MYGKVDSSTRRSGNCCLTRMAHATYRLILIYNSYMDVHIYLKVSKWQLPVWGVACTADASTNCTYCKSIACRLWQAVGAMYISKPHQLKDWRQRRHQTIS